MSSQNNRRLVLIAVLAAAAFTARAADGLKKGDALPPLAGMALEGNVPATQGKVVWLDFWASWCGPCRASFPVLDKLYAKYKDRGLVVLGVSVDDDPAKMKKFLAEHPVTFPTVLDAQHKLVAAVNVPTMPTSLLIDTSGKIVSVHRGFKGKETEEAVEREIEALLGDKKP